MRPRLCPAAEAKVAAVLDPDVEESFVKQSGTQGVGQRCRRAANNASGLNLGNRGRREGRPGMAFQELAIGHEEVQAAQLGRCQGFRGAGRGDFPDEGIETGLTRKQGALIRLDGKSPEQRKVGLHHAKTFARVLVITSRQRRTFSILAAGGPRRGVPPRRVERLLNQPGIGHDQALTA